MALFQLQRAARLADLAIGLPTAVTLPDGQRVCLVRDGERVYAVVDSCTHKGFAISGGDMVGPCVLECPWHGARFDVRTGRATHGPATEDLTTLSVRVIGEEIFVGPRSTKL
jgi:3-phenylpropionate/trans-cinnamate dioxygenase ferredoxin component